MEREAGAVRRTRGERAPHSGQSDGSSHSAIGRNCVNGPHFLHIYSYVGIHHLHTAKTHPAAAHSVGIMETIPVDSWVVSKAVKRVVRFLRNGFPERRGGRT